MLERHLVVRREQDTDIAYNVGKPQKHKAHERSQAHKTSWYLIEFVLYF